jgi:hypothetical protein
MFLTRSQKIEILQKLSKGKRGKDLKPQMNIALMAIPQSRKHGYYVFSPEAAKFKYGPPFVSIENFVAYGKEDEFEARVKEMFPDHEIEITIISAEEFDSIREKLEIEY